MSADRPSVLDRVIHFDVPSDVIACHWLGHRPAYVLSEHEVLLGLPTEQSAHKLHEGGILDCASDGKSLITGGDDGKVMRLSADSEGEQIVSLSGWIDRVAIGASGTMAYSCGKIVWVKEQKGEAKSLQLPSAVGGMAFFPKGLRLAIAHYNGASLWFPNSAAKPEFLEWKGSHLGITVSPDGRFVVTTMQEAQLHGWRIADGRNMRMSGYPGKIRSFSWSADGKHLATAGANCAVIWPFAGKDGPMGQQPQLLSPGLEDSTKLAVVACHPTTDVVALGYSDGMILLTRMSDGAEIIVRKPDQTAVLALSWRHDGQGLAFGIEGAKAGLAAL